MAIEPFEMRARRRQAHRDLPLLPHHAQANLLPADLALLDDALAAVPGRVDTAEVGTLYGGSALLGAWHAKQRDTRHWCLDQFGRDGSCLVAGEPTLELAWAHLRAEDLHRHAVLVPGDTSDGPLGVGRTFADRCLGLVLIDGCHTAEWARLDTAWAMRVLRWGGFLLYHDALPRADDPPRYAEYQQAVRELSETYNLTQRAAAEGGSLVVYQLPGGQHDVE
jgi:hypothetical protein